MNRKPPRAGIDEPPNSSKELREKLDNENKLLKNLRLKKQNEVDDEKLRIMRGKVISAEEITSTLPALASEIRRLIKERDIQHSNVCPGMTTNEMRTLFQQTRDEMFNVIKNGMLEFVDTVKENSIKQVASEPTSINTSGAGRPTEPNSRRSKATVKRARKKAAKKTKS